MALRPLAGIVTEPWVTPIALTALTKTGKIKNSGLQGISSPELKAPPTQPLHGKGWSEKMTACHIASRHKAIGPCLRSFA
jgi:hypothetical protein